MRLGLFVLLSMAAGLSAQSDPTSCSKCAVWNEPQRPFRIYGDSYYVGTHGLGSVLITSKTGHILIDGALAESAAQIAANIRSLGFRVEEIKLILNSHVHYDHAGGIAELQKMSGARVAASRWTADVMRRAAVPRDDPQFGIIRPIARVARVETFEDGETLHAGSLNITAHLTPGHTPGGTSWTWQSCDGGRCLNLVYADSLTPVSADGFLFSRRKEYPRGSEDFERSYAFLESAPCDILLTPHPEVSSLWDRLEKGKFEGSAACRALAESSREQLRKRLATERAGSR
jgi:metallo-beta-lactamase class B